MVQIYQQEGSQESFELNSRIRSVEGRYNLLAERLLIINHNLIEQYKKTMKEIQLINSDLSEIKHDLNTTKEVINNIVKELENFASKNNVKVIEKYIDLLNPLNFVTEEQLNKVLDEKLRKRGEPIARTSNK